MSQTAEYAMRAMAVVASAGDELVAGGDIAEHSSIPAPYLSKLLRRLVVAKLLVAKRGRGGGFRLARPGAEISFAEILEAVDAMPPANHCAFGWANCDRSRPCPLHDAYEEAHAGFLTWAHKTRLTPRKD